MNEAKAGQLILVDEGCYSDHTVMGFFVVLKTFVPISKLSEYLCENPGESKRGIFNTDKFLAFLIREELLLEVEHGNLFLSAYSDCTEVRFWPS